jgi:hypothetical protein
VQRRGGSRAMRPARGWAGSERSGWEFARREGGESEVEGWSSLILPIKRGYPLGVFFAPKRWSDHQLAVAEAVDSGGAEGSTRT